MKPAPDRAWNPDPQLLAAYFDGELEGCAGLADLRARLEAWLESHPEALTAGDEYRRLRKILSATVPPEPDEATWNATLDRIDARRRPAAVPTSRNPWLGAGACAAAIALAFGILFGALRYSVSPHMNQQSAIAPHEAKSPDADDTDVFPVATASDVLILRVEGQDTESLVVGELPMGGPMELAAPGEVQVFVVRPDERARLPRVRQDNSSRPMIWASLDSERE